MVPRRLTTWDDRLQKDLSVVLDERHKVCVALDIDDHNPLTRVFLLIGVFQDIEHITSFDMENNFLKGNASRLLKQPVLLRAPREILHVTNIVQRVPIVNARLTPSS